jgi:hypothetical protein
MNVNMGQYLTWSNIETTASSSFSIISSSSGDERTEHNSPPNMRYLNFLNYAPISKTIKDLDSVDNTEREGVRRSESSITVIKRVKSMKTLQTLKSMKTGTLSRNPSDVDKNKSVLLKKNTDDMHNRFGLNNSGNPPNLPSMVRRQSSLHLFIHQKESFLNNKKEKNPQLTSSNTLNLVTPPPTKLPPSLSLLIPSSTSPRMPKKIMHKLEGGKKVAKATDGVMLEIHKNIEKTSLNLNDPQFFYSEFFQKVMTKKHTTRKKRRVLIDQENLIKRLDNLEKMFFRK